MSKTNGLRNRKILVVEDVEINQELARHIMESWGCIVDVAENGLRAIEKINSCEYDLVLMDIQMPLMDGMEATKHIREMPDIDKSSVPVVALSANIGRGDFDDYLKAGMNDCLAKPFSELELLRIVQRNVRNGNIDGYPDVAELKNENIQESANRLKAAEQLITSQLYNLSLVESISGGDRSFVENMLGLFLQTVPRSLEELSGAASGKDWQALSKLAHKLKSTIDSMGIVSLKQDIRSIETGAKNGPDPDRLLSLTNKVVTVMNRVMDQVRVDHKL